MQFFDSVRSWFSPLAEAEPIPYGRGIRALPNPKERELFDLSSEAFMKKEFLRGYENFLESLIHHKNVSPLSHLQIEKKEDGIHFRMVQGYALIRGKIDAQKLYADVLIAEATSLPVAAKRRFLERNFQLTYCRFSRKNGNFILSTRIDNETVTPQKIFFPLRELALNADFEKEFIAGEFDESALLETDHVQPVPSEKIVFFRNLMRQWIAQTRASLVGLLSNDNTGMASFSYLTLLLQIDYLFNPHKKMAREISEKINGYFTDDEKMAEDKNADLENYIEELETLDDTVFASQFFDSVYTFSPFDQALHDEVASFIDESLNKVRWYKNNRSHHAVRVIYRYVSLYILYNYGLHPSLRALFHIHVELHAPEFFVHMGETPLYDPKNRTLDHHAIALRIASAIEPYVERYKNLKNFSDSLDYTDLDRFSQSFYLHIKNLDYTES